MDNCRDVNLVVFNYRGFGRSEGIPSPKSIAMDTEDIVAFLIAPYSPSQIHGSPNGCGVSRLGIHGRSIGGVAAIHVAWKFGDRIRYACTSA